MPKPCWEWFDDLETAFERDEIEPKVYEKAMRTLKPSLPSWRDKIKGKLLSIRFPSLTFWRATTGAKTTAYRRRIESYLKRHPKATLKEARGH